MRGVFFFYRGTCMLYVMYCREPYEMGTVQTNNKPLKQMRQKSEKFTRYINIFCLVDNLNFISWYHLLNSGNRRHHLQVQQQGSCWDLNQQPPGYGTGFSHGATYWQIVAKFRIFLHFNQNCHSVSHRILFYSSLNMSHLTCL